MTTPKKILALLAAIIVLNIGIMVINILQNGLGGWNGKSTDVILKVKASEANPVAIDALSKSEVMQLFYSASPPPFASMKGEYQAKVLPVGVQSGMAGYFTHHFFGPGRWVGKAFMPQGKNNGLGYNIFSSIDDGGKETLHRTRKIDTWIGKSEIDNKDSFHIVYKKYNGGLVHSMRDEIRKINDTLYLGMGHMAVGGGSINPAPFVLYQEPTAWVGPDKEER